MPSAHGLEMGEITYVWDDETSMEATARIRAQYKTGTGPCSYHGPTPKRLEQRREAAQQLQWQHVMRSKVVPTRRPRVNFSGGMSEKKM